MLNVTAALYNKGRRDACCRISQPIKIQQVGALFLIGRATDS